MREAGERGAGPRKVNMLLMSKADLLTQEQRWVGTSTVRAGLWDGSEKRSLSGNTGQTISANTPVTSLWRSGQGSMKLSG